MSHMGRDVSSHQAVRPIWEKAPMPGVRMEREAFFFWKRPAACLQFALGSCTYSSQLLHLSEASQATNAMPRDWQAGVGLCHLPSRCLHLSPPTSSLSFPSPSLPPSVSLSLQSPLSLPPSHTTHLLGIVALLRLRGSFAGTPPVVAGTAVCLGARARAHDRVWEKAT